MRAHLKQRRFIFVNSNQFKHIRMTDTEGANVEISNPIYMKDYEDEDVAEDFPFDPNKVTFK